LNSSDLKAKKATILASLALSRTILHAPLFIFLAAPSCASVCAEPSNDLKIKQEKVVNNAHLESQKPL
jgi:hypothetical protein